MKRNLSIVENLLTGLFFVLLLWGGMEYKTSTVVICAIILGIIMFLYLSFTKKLSYPRTLLSYQIFIVIFILNNLFVSINPQKSWDTLGHFIAGGMFMIFFQSLASERMVKIFEKIILLTGISFGLLFFASLLSGSTRTASMSLYLPISSMKTHNHLADLWSVVLVIVLHRIFINPKNLVNWFLFALGVYLLSAGLSRTSYLSLAAGAIYLLFTLKLSNRQNKILKTVLVICLALFLFAAVRKPTLFSRPYFVQGIVGVLKYPFGVGVRNYDVITADPWTNIFRVTSFSTMTHNLVVEILAGLGIFGVSFIVWLVRVFGVLKTKGREVVSSAVFLVLTVNFMFDFTYFIPTMIWLWFASLGLALASRQRNT